MCWFNAIEIKSEHTPKSGLDNSYLELHHCLPKNIGYRHISPSIGKEKMNNHMDNTNTANNNVSDSFTLM